MPDLFDNIFNRIGLAVRGKTNQHYQGTSQVNSGRYYSYHTNGTNNNYWLPSTKKVDTNITKVDDTNIIPIKQDRKSSVSSIGSEEEFEEYTARSRYNSVSSSK